MQQGTIIIIIIITYFEFNGKLIIITHFGFNLTHQYNAWWYWYTEEETGRIVGIILGDRGIECVQHPIEIARRCDSFVTEASRTDGMYCFLLYGFPCIHPLA